MAGLAGTVGRLLVLALLTAVLLALSTVLFDRRDLR